MLLFHHHRKLKENFRLVCHLFNIPSGPRVQRKIIFSYSSIDRKIIEKIYANFMHLARME